MNAFLHKRVRSLPNSSSETIHPYVGTVTSSELVFVNDVGKAPSRCSVSVNLICREGRPVLFQLSVKTIFSFGWRIFFHFLDGLLQ